MSVSTPPRLMSGCYNVDSKYGIALQTANTGHRNATFLAKFICTFGGFYDIQNSSVLQCNERNAHRFRLLKTGQAKNITPCLLDLRLFSITITLVLIHTTYNSMYRKFAQVVSHKQLQTMFGFHKLHQIYICTAVCSHVGKH